MFALDSSFLVKLLIQEEWTDEAEAIVEEVIFHDGTLVASDLALAEVGSAILRHTRAADADGAGLVAGLRELDVDFVPLDGILLRSSMELANRLDVTFYDAIHLALARGMTCNLITEDRELLEKADWTMTLRQASDVLAE